MKISIVKPFKFIVPLLVIFSSLFSAATGNAFSSSQPPLSEHNSTSLQLPVVSPSDGETTGSCYSLDVIFVIDQSSTMSDSNYPTDPTIQRQTAVQAMVDWLASNVLDVCPKARHQVGVISFGTNSQVDLPLTEIAPNSMEDLLALEKRVNKKIVASDLGGTEPLEAFRLISKMFDGSTISSDEFRKHVVVFLTDGLIGCDSFTCNPPNGIVKPAQTLANYIDEALPFDSVLLEREQCISALYDVYKKMDIIPFEKINKCYSDNNVPDDAYNKSTYLYMVLLNFGEAWPSEVKNIYGEVAESHAGEVVDFHDKGDGNRQEIPTYFVTVLSKLAGVPTGNIPCGGVVINPYLDKAVFRFFKFSPDTKVSIRYVDANGAQHQMSGGESNTGGFDLADYEAYNTNERYIFNNPYPGVWFIESDFCKNGGINVFYQPVQVNPGGFTLSLPSLGKYPIPPYYDVSSPTYLTYQMHNDAGEIVDNNDQDIFNINVQATVTPPTGEVKKYTLTWIPEDHQFKSTEPLMVPVSGAYKVSFIGTTKIHTGEYSVGSEVSADTFSSLFDTDLVVFQNDNLGFLVSDSKLFLVNITSPSDKQILPIHSNILSGWPLKISPILIRIRVTGEDGQPLTEDISQVLTDPDNALIASISHGSRTSESVVLSPNPKVPGEYEGLIQNFDAEGELKLIVELKSNYKDGFLPAKKVNETVFVRRDDNLFSRSTTYKYLLYAFLLFLVIKVILCFVNARNPIAGKLIFENSGDMVFELFLSGSVCARNRHYFGPSSPGLKENHETMDVYIVEAVAIPARIIRQPRVDENNNEPVDTDVELTPSIKVNLLLNSTSLIQKILFVVWHIFLPIPDGWWSRNYTMLDDTEKVYGDENHAYSVHYKKI